DCPCDERVPGGFARERGALPVDDANLIAETVAVELETVGPERVRLDGIRAGGDVRAMNAFHESAIRHVQLIKALVEEDAQFVKPCPHGAVEDDDLLGEHREKIFLHALGVYQGSKYEGPTPRVIARSRPLGKLQKFV